jgi:hypothetical protein
MSASAPRKPVLGAYQPDTAGKCAICGRHRQLCSAHCRETARRLRPPKRRARHTPPAEPARDIAELSATTQHLITIGQALYGRDWKRPTARILDVDIKTIWRWLHGHRQPTINDILKLLEAARQRIDDLARVYTGVVKQLPGRPANNGDFPPVGRSQTVTTAQPNSGSRLRPTWFI